MFNVSGIIQLTFMCSTDRILNIKTDASVIHVAKIFTFVQALDRNGFYCMIHQTLLGKEKVGWEVQFAIAF